VSAPLQSLVSGEHGVLTYNKLETNQMHYEQEKRERETWCNDPKQRIQRIEDSHGIL